jgi:two-component system, OmpR family, sensor kinase
VGRLFWKFFFFTLLAQLIAAAGIGTAVWFKTRASDERVTIIETGPPAAFTTEAGAIALQYGGIDALRKLMERSDPRHQFYAVRDDGQEILGRTVDPKLVREARSMARQDERNAARELKAEGGRTYVLFSVREGRLHGMVGALREHEPPGMPAHGSAMEGRVDGPPDGPRFGESPPRPPPGSGAGLPPPHPPHLFGGVFLAFMPVVTAIIGSLIFALGIAWYFSKPIRNLRSAFDAAAAGNLDSRVGVMMGNRRDELTDLGRDFDRMANRLRALMDGQRKLLHDVSHELRSPLARMQAAIGLARQDPRKIEASLDRVERESMRMDKLVGELLTLSRLEAGVLPQADDRIDIDEIIMDVIEDAQFGVDPWKCRIEFSERSGATVKGSPDWLRRAIENVVRNAVKYCEANGEIVIAARAGTEKRTVMIQVLDRGPGVPESELVTIFEPFFRGTHGEQRQDGHGLGLAIAKRIVEGQGGTIRASNRDGGGLCVEIVLPVA